MLFELIEAFQTGKEVYTQINKAMEGNHYDNVVKAEAMLQALDVNDGYIEGIKEILQELSVVDDSDRDYVKCATYYYRSLCYYDLGEFSKARQNIAYCTNIQIDDFTLNKELIKDFQQRARNFRKEMDREMAPKTQQKQTPSSYYPQNSNDRKRQQKPQKQQQVQPCTNIHYSRAELLRIVAECDGNTFSYSENTVMSCNVERLRTNLQRRGINISKTQIGKVSTYRGLVDYIESHTVVENSHNSSSKPTQSNHQTQNQVSKNNDMASNTVVDLPVGEQNKNHNYGSPSPEVLEAIKGSSKLLAVQIYIEQNGVDLASAKEAIDFFCDNMNVSPSSQKTSPDNKTKEPVYFSVDKVENIFVFGGSGVQCMTTTSRQGRVNLNYFADHTKMVVVNPSGKTVSAVVQSLEHSQYGSYFLPVDPNNSLKKDEFVRVKLKDISASEIEVGSKIYIEEDYNKIPKSDSLESAVDYYSLPFSMPVEDVFSIEGRGTIITGKIATGRVHVDDVIYLVKDGTVLSATVKGCEMFRKLLDQAEYGDNVGLLLQGVSPDQVKKGMMATAIKPEVLEVSSVLPSTSNDGMDMARPKDNTPVQKPDQSCPSTEEQEYLEELKECLADGEIGPRERRLLDKLASKLGISPERASELEASLSAPALTDDEKEYFEEVHAVLADGEISDKERRLLEKLRKMLDISEERAKEIESIASK